MLAATIVRRVRRLAPVALLASVGMLCLSIPHWSPQMRSASVTFNGQPSHDSAVYRAGDGSLLLRLRETAEAPYDAFYILDPARRQATSPNVLNYSVLLGFAFTWHTDQGGVLLGTAKSEVDPKVIVGPTSFEFTTLSRRRARVIF